MDNSDVLRILSKMAEEETFPNELFEASKENPKPYLLINLGKDLKGRERVYKVEAKLQEVEEGLHGSDDAAFILEFECELPVKLREHALFDVSSLLHFINRTISLPGFQFDELEEKAYFKHVHFSTVKGLDKKVIVSLLGLSILFIDLYSNCIEEVGTGEKTFIDVLEEMLRIGKEKLSD